MHFENHCQRTLLVLGHEMPHVHEWMDEEAWTTGGFNPHHRRVRHHRQGIEQVRARWGDEAAKAAERHVLDDLFGPEANDVELIPLDEADFIAKGY